jgi:hypothetical protein
VRTGGCGSTNAVLGCEQRYELEIPVICDEIDVGNAVAIDGALIRNQSDAFSAQGRWHVGEEYLDSGNNC